MKFTIVCAFSIFYVSLFNCTGSLDKTHSFDSVLYRCGFSKKLTEKFTILSISDSRGNKLYKEQFNAYYFDGVNNIISDDEVLVSEYSCLAIPKESNIDSVGLSHKLQDEGLQFTLNKVGNYEEIRLEKIGVSSFSLWSSCGISNEEALIQSDRLLIFKVINTKNFSEFNASFHDSKGHFSVPISERGCVFLDNPKDGYILVEGLNGYFAQANVNNLLTHQSVNFLSVRPPLTEEERCLSKTYNMWSNSRCIKKDFMHYCKEESLGSEIRVFTELVSEVDRNSCESIYSSLKNISNFDLSDKQLNSIYSVVGFNPAELDLRKNDINDISHLDHMDSLEYLLLSDNRLRFIPALPKNLKMFGAARNQINNLSGIKGLSKLESLGLNNNLIEDINGIESLISLDRIFLNFNKIRDLSSFSKLIQIKNVFLNANSIQDLSAFLNHQNLEWLELSRNKIVDISPIRFNTRLHRLNIGDNLIPDISILSAMNEMTHLEMDYNPISDLSPLESMSKLGYLKATYCNISDLNALKDLSELRELWLDGNPISDLSPLKNSSITLLKIDKTLINEDRSLFLDDQKCPVDGSNPIVRNFCQEKRMNTGA